MLMMWVLPGVSFSLMVSSLPVEFCRVPVIFLTPVTLTGLPVPRTVMVLVGIDCPSIVSEQDS